MKKPKLPAVLLATLALTITSATLGQTTSVDQRANLLNQIKEDPSNTELHYQLGALELFSFSDPDAAAFHYATATTTGIRYDSLHNEAVAHAQAGRYEPAVTLLQAALEQNPSPSNAATTLELLGDVLHTSGEYEAAATAYNDLFEITSKPMARYKNLRAHYANGETTSLSVPLQELRDEVKPHASELLALIYQTTGMHEYAVNELTHARGEAIETNDLQTLARVSTNLAALHYTNDDFNEALHVITDIHLITSDQTTSYVEGAIHLSMGEPQLAYDAFTRNQQDVTLTPERRFGAVIAAAGTLDTMNATRHMRALIGNQSMDLLSNTELSRTAAIAGTEALYRSGDAATAETLTRSLSLGDFTPDELITLGTITYEHHSYVDSIRAFTAATDHPDATETQQLTALRNHAHSLQANTQFAAAAALYAEYLAIAPYDTEALYHHGWALIHSNRTADAETAWREARSRGYAPAETAMQHLPN